MLLSFSWATKILCPNKSATMRHIWKHLAYVEPAADTKALVDKLFTELRGTAGVADFGSFYEGDDNSYTIGLTGELALKGRWDEDIGEILVCPGYESIVRDIWARLGEHYSKP